MRPVRHSILVLAVLAAPFAVSAQSAEPSFPERYEAAQTLRDTDLEAALAQHQALVAEGYERSYVPLAAILMDLGRVEEARAAYVSAVAAGNEYAKVKLASGDATGDFGAASDTQAGIAALEELATNPENERAIYTLADIYYRGEVVEADPKRAFSLFQPLAENGSPWALSRIGALNLSGDLGQVDAEAAAAAYSKAVALGHDRALSGLTEALIAAGRYEEAIEAADMAVEKDASSAALKRAQWHLDGEFGPLSDRKLGALMLASLVNEGDFYAARLASYRYPDNPRLLNTLDLDRMFAVLEEAGAQGNHRGTSAAARAYRKLDRRLPNARKRHARLIEQQGELLAPRTRAIEEIYAAYNVNAHRRSREAAAAILSGYDGEAFEAGMMELRGIERTAFVYVLQNELRDLGLYTGPRHGRLTSRTISAILRFCRDVGIADVCRHGPIQKDASRAIVNAVGTVKQSRGTQS